MKTIIVDDEFFTLEEIKANIKELDDFEIVGSYTNPLKALAEIENTKPDCAFLDIEMPGMSGIELADKLLEINPKLEVVFVTAFNHYATQAFEINALDYVLKPIDPDRFSKTVMRIKELFDIAPIAADSYISIQMFGRFEIQANGEPIKWSRTKAKELAAFLVNHKGKLVNKYRVCDELWPDFDTRRALNNLQTTMCSIRRSIGAIGRDLIKLEYSDESYILSLGDVAVDMDIFNRLYDSFVQAGDMKDARRAVEMYTYDLMEADGYLWAQPDRELLSRKYTEFLCALADNYYNGQNYQQTIDVIMKYVKKHLPDKSKQLMLLDSAFQLYGNKGLEQNLLKLIEICRSEHDSEIDEAAINYCEMKGVKTE